MPRGRDARVAFGKPLAEQGVVRDWIAESRVRIEQARLLVLKTAWLMDTVGNKGAHTEIQAIKIATPATAEWVLDKAIQAHGAGGRQPGLPAGRAVGRDPHAAPGRRPRRGAQERPGPRRAEEAGGRLGVARGRPVTLRAVLIIAIILFGMLVGAAAQLILGKRRQGHRLDHGVRRRSGRVRSSAAC